VILIVLVLTFAGTDWDQDVLDYTLDSWKTTVINDLKFIDDAASCPSGYATVDYNFPGTTAICDVDRGTYKNTI